jgi:hypothetical protein
VKTTDYTSIAEALTWRNAIRGEGQPRSSTKRAGQPTSRETPAEMKTGGGIGCDRPAQESRPAQPRQIFRVSFLKRGLND